MIEGIGFYSDGSEYRPDDKKRVSKWIQSAIDNEGFKIGEISFIFCSREKHLELNRQFLEHDYHTDVITFDYSEADESAETKGIISGDIFIDPVTVEQNAEEYGVNQEEESLRVMIHGVLHLMGYDDSTDKEVEIMRSKEEFYLKQF